MRFLIGLFVVISCLAAASPARRDLYPEIAPYETGYLKVSARHEIYYEQSGNRQGVPALALHGGPGSGSQGGFRRFFDPSRYRVILFDQRGAGKSRPSGSVEENTTADLVADIEKLRAHLHVDRWLVYGGSWGSTLALAYGEAHPDRVRALVLRGIFLGTDEEIQWSFRPGGVDRFFPDAFERLVQFIPAIERSDLLRAYHRRIFDSRRAVRAAAVREWNALEDATGRLVPDAAPAGDVTDADIDRARIESHYFVNHSFLAPNQLLDRIGKVRDIPGVIIQGRYDMSCPFGAAWALHRAWPKADFRIVPDAGHSWREPGIVHETVLATDRLRVTRPGRE